MDTGGIQSRRRCAGHLFNLPQWNQRQRQAGKTHFNFGFVRRLPQNLGVAPSLVQPCQRQPRYLLNLS